MSLKNFLNVDIEKMKENKKKRELEELEPIPKAIKEEIKLKKAIEKKKEEHELKKAKKLTTAEQKQLIMEEMEDGIKLVLDEEDAIEEKVEKVLEEFDDRKLDEIKLQDAIEEKELREQYKLATGKDALTLKGNVRKSFLAWKNKQ